MAHSSDPQSTIRVMLVDDHRGIREGLGRLVSSVEGMRLVGAAADGTEAIRRAREVHPDVVLMDLSMPHGDGIEATTRILAEHPRTAVLVLTCCSDRSRIRAALHAGACGYMLKDVCADDLTSSIRQAVQFVTRRATPCPARLAP